MSKHNDEIQDRTMTCPNKRCTMYNLARDTDAKRCGVCATKLKPYNYRTDAPPPRTTPPLLTTGNGPVIPITTEKKEEEEHIFSSSCDIDGCPIAPKALVIIPWTLYHTCIFLCKSFGVEWIAYLRGTLDMDKGIVTISDADDALVFPHQLATGVHVEAESNSVPADCVGSIHSHVGMQAFFSKEDREHFNHPTDLVINRDGDIEAVVRRQLKCHNWTRVKAEIRYTGLDPAIAARNALKQVLVIDKTPIQSSGKVLMSTSGRCYKKDAKTGEWSEVAADPLAHTSAKDFVGSTAFIPEDLRNDMEEARDGQVFTIR